MCDATQGPHYNCSGCGECEQVYRKLDKQIKDVMVLRDCGFDCQSELDRLLYKRDKVIRNNNCPGCGYQIVPIHGLYDFCYCNED